MTTRRVVAVVVTFQSDPAQVDRLLTALTSQVQGTVVVDNGSSDDILAALRLVATARDAHLVPLGTNRGIAAAQNVGIQHARRLQASHVLLSDDDSLPVPGMVAALSAAFDQGVERLAAVGPITVDARTGAAPLVFTDQRSGPRRIPELPSRRGELVEVAFLIASGCLIDLAAIDAVGPMREDLFIDHVDLEWGVRARAAGWQLRVVVGAHLDHSLGESTRRVPWRSRSVHVQAPVRNYFMVRNTVWLIRGTLLPARWRRGYTRWIARYIAYYLIAVAPRPRRGRLMLRGLRDGLAGRLGPLPEDLGRRLSG